MINRIKIVLFSLCLCFSTSNVAENNGTTGSDLLKACNESAKNIGGKWEGDQFYTAMCIFYIQSFVDAVTFTNMRLRAQNKDVFEICLPDNVPVRTVIDIVSTYIKNNQQLQSLPIGVTVYSILANEYPCKPKK